MSELKAAALACWLVAAGVPAAAQMGAASAVAPEAVVDAPAVARGKALYESRCGACHSVDANRVGPAHQGVVGRKAGSVPGFEYSKALASSQVIWTRANLLTWLAGPEAMIPGQQMGYSLGEARDREDVVAYLAALRAR